MMKLKSLLIFVLLSNQLGANQIVMKQEGIQTYRSPNQETDLNAEYDLNDEVEFDDLIGDVNQEIDTKALIPWWVPLLSSLSARFFVFYHKACKLLGIHHTRTRIK